jgi:diguanylate cyclase (GGDEF)-like protein/PAS domain S-box-containing protein
VREDATPFFATIHPDDRAAMMASSEHSMTTLQPWRLRYRHVLPDGRIVWAEGEASAERQPDGSVLWYGFIADVTERVHTQERLARSERLFRSMVEHLEELMFLVAVDADGGFRYLAGNRALHELLKVSPEVWEGARPRELFAPEQAAHFEAMYRRCLAEGKTMRYEERLEIPNVGCRQFQTTLTPIDGETGRIDLIVGIAVDVTERNRLLREAEAQWQLAEQRARTIEVLLESAGEGIFAVDTQENVVLWNPAAERILGYTAKEIFGRCAFEVLHSRYPDGSLMPREACLIHRAIQERRSFAPGEDFFLHRDGHAVPVRLSVSPLPDGGAVVVFADITTLKQMEAELRRQAGTDPLTGLANRRAFFVAGERLLAERKPEQPITLLMFDLDHFKQVNDRYGHAAGDQVLRSVAAILRETLREKDLAGRLGGEEFAVILPGTNVVGAQQLAERLRQAMAERVRIPGSGGETVTISIGVAAVPPDETTLDATLSRADAALYEAKEKGRNRVVVEANASQVSGMK